MAEDQTNPQDGGIPPQPPRPKTSNDEIFQRFLIHPLTKFDETSFMDLLEHSLSLSTLHYLVYVRYIYLITKNKLT